MKKTYKSITTFIVLLSLVTFNMKAQLSGTVTINSGAATAGTNYQTFNALAVVLNSVGVSGPLTVNVLANTGPYNEQVAFYAIPGMSSINKVTINGNNNLLTFNATSTAPFTMLLNGTKNLTVNNLKMEGTNATYAMVVILMTNASFNTFSACSFSCPANGTSSYQIPWSISSASNSPSSGGTANFNTAITCTLSGGYYSIFHYGLSAAPFTTDNSFIGCTIADWYYYCVYGYYAKNMTMKNCDINRMTRTTLTPGYFFYGWYMQGTMLDGNTIHDLFNMSQTLTGTLYGFYYFGYASPDPTNHNTFRNNIIRDMKWNGTTYMFYYNYNANNDYYNNTFSFDYAGSTSASTYIFYYCYNNGTNFNTWTNNIFSITQGGTGSKYAFYFGGNTALSVVNNNDYYVNSTNGFVGYWTSAAATFTAWQVQGPDQVGWGINPSYVNLATGDLHPTAFAIDNLAAPNGLVFDNQNAIRNQATPDLGALEFLTPNCVGTPTANGVASPNYALCPGDVATLGLTSLNPVAGFGYQWQTSTVSQVGPFTPIAGANGIFYTTPPMNANTWYSVVMTCTLPGGGSISPVGQVVIAGPTASTVPCTEGFENIGLNQRLPNCSWAATNLGAGALTYTSSNTGNRTPQTGTCFGSFSNSSPGTNYFFSNSIQMTAGITYSADVAWATEYFGYNNWNSLSIMVGPNQSTLGMVQVANINNPISGAYKVLGSTYTIPTTGTYYVAIKAVSSAGSAQYLSIDNLHITIPCQAGSPNTPTMTLAASALTVCANQPVSLTASGADTYTWNTGANGSGISDSPQAAGITNYIVVGQNALTGCTATLSVPVLVNPSPFTLIYANPASVCSGQPTNLSGLGAASYVWSNGASSANITVSPTVTTTYNVSGTNSYGCSASASQVITVLPLPTINATSSNADACKDDQITLTGAGGINYTWLASNSGLVLSGTQVNVTLSASTVFTVSGTNANGCVGKATLTQNISNCTGINKNTASFNGVNVYPNPTSGDLTIELNSGNVVSVEVVDLTGRVILSNTGSDSKVNVNLTSVANGIYYVKIKSNDSMEVVKVVKQ